MNLPNLDDQQLEAIEEMAYHGFTSSEIAEVIGIDSTTMENFAWQEKRHPVFNAYRKGYLKSQLELRQRIFRDAKNGSSPAQTLAYKILDNAKYEIGI